MITYIFLNDLHLILFIGRADSSYISFVVYVNTILSLREIIAQKMLSFVSFRDFHCQLDHFLAAMVTSLKLLY